MDERDLSTKHVYAFFGGSLGDKVALVYVCNEDCGGVLPGVNGVALPMGGGANESLHEAWVGTECAEEILRGPYKAVLIDGRYVA
jgi:hypothetical protein